MFFTKRKVIILFIISLIFFLLSYHDVKSSEITSVSGYAKVTDGDTIKIDTFKIRLDGIDAPEKKQKCKRPYFTIFVFTFYENYFCGQKSTEALIKKINNQKVNCKIYDIDYFKRFIGECFIRKTNLNSWLVSNGHAVAFRKYSNKYVSEETLAKQEKKGLWQGKFEMPWNYRKSKKN
tara:strand:- start:2103 stop:2636 length:534 start_codon:yes stop_codon:yes gene_type:complete